MTAVTPLIDGAQANVEVVRKGVAAWWELSGKKPQGVVHIRLQDVLLGQGANVWRRLHNGPSQQGTRFLPSILFKGPPCSQPAAVFPGTLILPTLC